MVFSILPSYSSLTAPVNINLFGFGSLDGISLVCAYPFSSSSVSVTYSSGIEVKKLLSFVNSLVLVGISLAKAYPLPSNSVSVTYSLGTDVKYPLSLDNSLVFVGIVGLFDKSL